MNITKNRSGNALNIAIEGRIDGTELRSEKTGLHFIRRTAGAAVRAESHEPTGIHDRMQCRPDNHGNL